MCNVGKNESYRKRGREREKRETKKTNNIQGQNKSKPPSPIYTENNSTFPPWQHNVLLGRINIMSPNHRHISLVDYSVW